MWKWHLLCQAFRIMWRDQARRLRQLQRLRGRLTREICSLDTSWESSTHFAKQMTGPSGPVLPTCSSVAIVMQGPIITANHLTLQTIKLYRKAMPQQELILSTWEGEFQDVCKQARDLGVHVVTIPPVSFAGPSNINRQICSTLAGLRAAHELGVEFVLKTRTDTRLYATNVCDFLVGLIRSFPLEGTKQRHRIIVLDLATRMYVPFHAADILMFGHIDDLMPYWDRSLLDSVPRERVDANTFGEYLGRSIPEVVLCESYLDRIGHPHEKSIRGWWRVLSELFLVVDRSSLGFLWPKYNYEVGHAMSKNDQLRNLALVTFRDWMNIALFAKQPVVEVDQLVDQPINGLLSAA